MRIFPCFLAIKCSLWRFFPTWVKISCPPGELPDNPSVFFSIVFGPLVAFSFSCVRCALRCTCKQLGDATCVAAICGSRNQWRKSMNKVILFATLAVFLTGVSFAQRGGAARPGPSAGTFAPNARTMAPSARIAPDARTMPPDANVKVAPNARTAANAKTVDPNATNAKTVSPNATTAPNAKTVAPNSRTVAPDAGVNSPNAQQN